MPFDYSEAPAEFQKRIAHLLQPLIREDKVIVYIDDILIATETVDANLEVLYDVLVLLGSHGFELNLSKCQFLKRKIEFLRYIVSGEGITISERHTTAVGSFPQPTNVHEVRRFLGLANYFRKFIAGLALLAHPLHNLLRVSAEFIFYDDCR